MTDLFADKAHDYDSRPVPAQISDGVSRAMDAAIPWSAHDIVLDFGAGTGLVAARIAPKVQMIWAVDVSPSMLAQLAEKPVLKGKVEVFCQDVLIQPLGKQADVVVSAMAAHHVEHTDALLRTLFDHLRPGGRLALADLDREDGTFHPPGIEGVFHAGFERGPLAEVAREVGFTDITIVTACEVEREGRQYPVFLLTARKP